MKKHSLGLPDGLFSKRIIDALPSMSKKQNPSTLYVPALERPEGVSQQDYMDMEEFQQRINAVSLERVKAYYRRLRYFVLHCIAAPQRLQQHSKYFTLKKHFVELRNLPKPQQSALHFSFMLKGDHVLVCL